MRAVHLSLFAVVMMLALFAGAPASAQLSNTATAGVWATIIKSLTVSKLDDLYFGQVAPGTQGCTVVLSPTGIRSVTAGDCMLAFGDAIGPARFAVDGAADESFSITVGGPGIVSNGFDNMTIGQFTTDSGTSGSLNASGQAEFYVGATLSIAPGQSPGTYEGDFTVTVEYE